MHRRRQANKKRAAGQVRRVKDTNDHFSMVVNVIANPMEERLGDLHHRCNYLPSNGPWLKAKRGSWCRVGFEWPEGDGLDFTERFQGSSECNADKGWPPGVGETKRHQGDAGRLSARQSAVWRWEISVSPAGSTLFDSQRVFPKALRHNCGLSANATICVSRDADIIFFDPLLLKMHIQFRRKKDFHCLHMVQINPDKLLSIQKYK